MVNHGCWQSEYDWEVSQHSNSQSRETVLCVLFDNGTQRQFSSVRIILVCSNDVNPEHYKAWQITPQSSPVSVVNRVSSESQDRLVTRNALSLPICNIVFMADRHSARSHTISQVAKTCGELVLGEAEGFNHVIFEFDQPLTENTQSVSVSFSSSYLLCTMMTRDVFSDPSSDHSAVVGRIVRVLPVTPTSQRRTITLPIDVLLLIFANFCFPPTHGSWRKDILSSALVCREWSCALGMLSIDFRSENSQQEYPPEIANFANVLVAHPSLGLGIKYLSVGYLEKHPAWDPYPALSSSHPPPMFLAKLRLQRSDLRRSQFGKAFLSILNAAKNVQTLCLDPKMDLVVPPDDLADALRGLSKLEVLRGRCTLSMAQLVSCVATWPSLKHLCVLGALPPSNHTFPLASPSCRLTTIKLADIPIKDDELVCLVSASGLTLERLTLIRISQLTNTGLRAALDTVCTSLRYLHIMADVLARDRGEERALDATITHMTRLTTLEIAPEVASERMVERRAEAFVQPATPTLPEVNLYLIVGTATRDCGLIRAAERDWPGWKMDHRPGRGA